MQEEFHPVVAEHRDRGAGLARVLVAASFVVAGADLSAATCIATTIALATPQPSIRSACSAPLRSTIRRLKTG